MKFRRRTSREIKCDLLIKAGHAIEYRWRTCPHTKRRFVIVSIDGEHFTTQPSSQSLGFEKVDSMFDNEFGDMIY